ncbi:MAG TPA: NUDIX hydrolase [Pseudonocardiaceae bacterium]
MARSADIRAAGTVLWRSTDSGRPDVAVIHRPRYDDWSLPKGKLDRDETIPACAVRETVEETGHPVVLDRPLIQVRYPVQQSQKSVDYFAAHVTGPLDPALRYDNNEVDQLRWLPIDETRRLLTYDWDRDVLTSFGTTPPDATTVLLVRHGKAGNKSVWNGDDGQRPLSPAGKEQAAALRVLLPLFAPNRAYSAPVLRCQQTIEGVATDLGLTMVPEPAFTEAAFQADPAACLRRFEELVRAGGRPMIASQGGTIPGLVQMLAERGGLSVSPPVPCKKGSVWVLSFAPGEPEKLLAAGYLPSALPAPSPQPLD